IIYILRRQGFAHGAAERRRRIGDGYAGAPHRLDLVAGLALAARDDGAGMAHAPPRRSRHAGDEADDRIAADADAGRLTEAGGGRLRHRLVGERARARDDADLAALVDVARHDA